MIFKGKSFEFQEFQHQNKILPRKSLEFISKKESEEAPRKNVKKTLTCIQKKKKVEGKKKEDPEYHDFMKPIFFPPENDGTEDNENNTYTVEEILNSQIDDDYLDPRKPDNFLKELKKKFPKKI